MKQITLVGQKFGRLVATEKLERINKITKYKCLCDCGNNCVITYNNLKTGTTRSCGCLRRDACKERERRKNHPTHGRVLSYYKRNAKNRNLEWNLDLDDFTKIINGDCYYCGAKPYTRMFTGKEISYNGIDRVDNSTGYEIKNVVTCCWQCNTAKNDLSEEEFRNWLMNIYEKFITGGVKCLE
jgi:hypothetical protein